LFLLNFISDIKYVVIYFFERKYVVILIELGIISALFICWFFLLLFLIY